MNGKRKTLTNEALTQLQGLINLKYAHCADKLAKARIENNALEVEKYEAFVGMYSATSIGLKELQETRLATASFAESLNNIELCLKAM